MMKILLVNSNTEASPYPVSPLGLCMLASEIEEAGFEVKLFDGMWESGYTKDVYKQGALSAELENFKPDVVGVSVRNIDDVVMNDSTYYVDVIEQLCIKPIKKYGKAITVLGGSGYSLFPYELLKRWKFDYGVVGPGEETFVSLIRAIENGNTNSNIKGVLTRNKHNQITGTAEIKLPDRQSILNLNYSHIDQHLAYEPYQQRSAYPIQTKRGCALKCLYCSYPTLEGSTYQLRTAKDVVDEIEGVIERLHKVTFEFVDSTFNHPPEHAENICREIIRRGLSVRLRTMGVNPSGVTVELIDLMRKAGFTQIDCTPDSASDEMLKQLQKGFSRKRLMYVAKILKDADMPTMWFFVLGGPGENHKTLDETFDFIEKHIDERDLVHLTEGLRIYPNTGLEKVAIKEGLISKTDSLLQPVFFVSPLIGQENLDRRVKEFTDNNYNCLRSADSTPSQEMIRKAIELKKKENLMDEPMFRTLLRIRKNEFNFK